MTEMMYQGTASAVPFADGITGLQPLFLARRKAAKKKYGHAFRDVFDSASG